MSTYIKNAILKRTDWRADGFYETKKEGFVAAINVYTTPDGEEKAVMFKDGVAFMIWDDDTEAPATKEELEKALKAIIKEEGVKCRFEDYFPDNYIELCNGVTCEQLLVDAHNLTKEICDDIIDRCKDLANYFEVVEEEM